MRKIIAGNPTITPTVDEAKFVELINAANTDRSYADINVEDAKTILGFVRLLPTLNATKLSNISRKKLILVLGKTGVGKTTFLNYIAGIGYEYNDSTQRFSTADTETFPTSSSVSESHTQTPNIYPIPGTNVCIVDCAGFGDTKGKHYDIYLALYLRRVLEKNSVAHVIWVVSDGWMNEERSQLFVSAYNALIPLFGHEHRDRLPLTIAVNYFDDPEIPTTKRVENVFLGYLRLPPDRAAFKAFSDLPGSIIGVDLAKPFGSSEIAAHLKSLYTSPKCQFEYVPVDPAFISRLNLARTSLLEYSRIVTTKVDRLVDEISSLAKRILNRRMALDRAKTEGRSKITQLEADLQSLLEDETELTAEIRAIDERINLYKTQEAGWVAIDEPVKQELHSGIFSRGAKLDVNIPGWVMASRRRVRFGQTDYSKRYQDRFTVKTSEQLEFENLDRLKRNQTDAAIREKKAIIETINSGYAHWWNSYSQADKDRVAELKKEINTLEKELKHLNDVLEAAKRSDTPLESFGRDVSLHVEAYFDQSVSISYWRARCMTPIEGGLLKDETEADKANLSKKQNDLETLKPKIRERRREISVAKASLVVEGDIISSPTATYEAWIKSKEEEISNLERDLNVLKVEWQTYQEPLDQVIRVCIPFLEHTANLADRRDLVQYLGAQSISALLMMPTIAESEKLYVPTVNSALWAAVTGSLYAFMRTSGGFNQLCNDWFGPDTAAGIHSHLLAYTGVDAHSLESDILSSGIIKIRQRLIEELNRGDTLASLERDGIKTTIDRFGRGETLQDVLAILWVFSRTFDINVTYFDRDTLIQGKFFSSHNGRPIVHVEQASGRHYAVLHHTLRAQIDTKRVTFGREVYGAGGDDTTASHVETDAIVTLLSPLSTEKPIVYTRLFKSAVASASHQEAEQNRRIEWLTTDLVELLSTSHRLVYLPNETSINLDAFGVKILGRPYAQDPTDKWALVPVTVGPTDFYFSEMLSDPTISDVLRTYALLHAVGYPIQISGPVACRDGKVTFQLLEEGTQRLVARVEIESRK